MTTSKVVAKLVFPGQTFEIVNDDFILIGSGVGCDILLNDPSISSIHATFRRFPGGFTLNDLMSETEFFVKNKRIGLTKREIMISTCVLRLGNVRGYLIIPPDMEKDLKQNLKSLKEKGLELTLPQSKLSVKEIIKEYRKKMALRSPEQDLPMIIRKRVKLSISK